MSKCPFTIRFDKTGNAQETKQCNVPERFWNEQNGAISTKFLKVVCSAMQKEKRWVMQTLCEQD